MVIQIVFRIAAKTDLLCRDRTQWTAATCFRIHESVPSNILQPGNGSKSGSFSTWSIKHGGLMISVTSTPYTNSNWLNSEQAQLAKGSKKSLEPPPRTKLQK